MDIVGRLKIYMQHKGMQISQFADTAQIPRPTLSQILSGRNKKISNELMEKLHMAFPTLNINWLLFGDEPMETNSKVFSSPTPAPSTSPSQNNPIPESEISIEQADQFEITDEPLSTPVINNIPESPQHTPVSLSPDSNKRIQTVIVFYDDKSFEIFSPTQR